MKYLAAFALAFLPVFLLLAEYEKIPCEYIAAINTAFTKFRSDMAKEGFDARLSDYFVHYRRLSSEYEERSNVLSVVFVHISMSEKRKEQDYLGFITGEAGDFIVDIDTQEIIETRYFE